jgi:hypothetical protein
VRNAGSVESVDVLIWVSGGISLNVKGSWA